MPYSRYHEVTGDEPVFVTWLPQTIILLADIWSHLTSLLVITVGLTWVIDIVGVIVTGGVTDGVLVGVWVGSVEQSVTVLTAPKESKVTTYFIAPSIIVE